MTVFCVYCCMFLYTTAQLYCVFVLAPASYALYQRNVKMFFYTEQFVAIFDGLWPSGNLPLYPVSPKSDVVFNVRHNA